MYKLKSYCISLKNNHKERKRCKKIFSKHNLDVDFHVVDRSPLGGHHGCFTSHLQVLQKGIDYFNKDENNFILIMEDDVYFECNVGKIQQLCDSLITLNGDWCCCLGYFSTSVATFVNKNIISLNVCNCAHAYIVPIRTAKKLVLMKWNNVPYDIAWHKEVNFYAPYPMIAYQLDHPSSISSDVIDSCMKTIGFKTIATGCQFWCTSGYLLFIILILFFIILFIKAKYL